MSTLFIVLVWAVVMYAIFWVLGKVALPQPIRNIVYAIFVVLAIGILLDKIGWYHFGHRWRE